MQLDIVEVISGRQSGGNMRIAFISDIHANYTALQAVLEDIKQARVDKTISLGDVANLGPQPVEVINHLKTLNISS